MQTATAEQSTVRKHCFWTTGEYMTNITRTFIREGEFRKAYLILSDGGIPDEEIKQFFLLKREMIGEDSRVAPFDFVKCEFPEDIKESLSEYYFYAMRTSSTIPQEDDYFLIRNLEDQIEDNDYEDIIDYYYLRKVFSRQELLDLISEKACQFAGYELAKGGFIGEKYIDGAITPCGKLILCNSQQHVNLYPFLYQMYLSDDSSWMESVYTFHISSSQLSGKTCGELEHYGLYSEKQKAAKKTEMITDPMLKTLFEYREWISGAYGGFKTSSTVSMIMEFEGDKLNKGGKFNNLSFLKKYYPLINTPVISLEPIEGVENCIRTSPKKSLAGLLNSKFDITENSVAEIESDWEKFKDVVSGNELNYFYQEKLEGLNGVCHYWEKGSFSFEVSENRGDIVNGKKGNTTLDFETGDKLRSIARELYKDLKQPVQLEFVVTPEGKLYIVQLRLLKNNFDNTVVMSPNNSKYATAAIGRTFSAGRVTCKKSEALIVDEDCDSELLLGKKALIVRNKSEFSHVLALSKTLRIPSIYEIGDAQIPEQFELVAENETAWILDVNTPRNK